MRFPLQIIQCPFRKKETVAVVVHKISELVLCKDRIFTNITPQVFTLTRIRWSNRWLCQNKNISKLVLTQPLFICLLL